MTTTIAWLGTGLLGSEFVRARLERGETVRVWNRTAQKASALAEAGAVPCASAAEAVRGASRVHVCVADDAAVEAVLASVLDALEPGATVFDHSTTSPEGAHRRQAELTARGVPYLHCPVFMSPAAARAAKGTLLVSAAPALVATWRETLATMTGEVLETGQDAARAATLKLLGNAMIIAATAATADVLALGVAQGVSIDDALALIGRFPLGMIVGQRGTRIAQGDFRAGFELTMAQKDVRLMIEAAHGAPLGVLPAVHARLGELIAAGHGQDDLAALGIEAARAASGRA